MVGERGHGDGKLKGWFVGGLYGEGEIKGWFAVGQGEMRGKGAGEVKGRLEDRAWEGGIRGWMKRG